jgi:hypothetical protein
MTRSICSLPVYEQPDVLLCVAIHYMYCPSLSACCVRRKSDVSPHASLPMLDKPQLLLPGFQCFQPFVASTIDSRLGFGQGAKRDPYHWVRSNKETAA